MMNVEEELKEETKEEKKEEQKKEEPTVTLCHDKEWLAILQLAQEKIPLQFQAPHFSTPLITKEAVAEKMSQIGDVDLSIVFNSAKTYDRTYQRVHPTTRDIIEKFGLDDRLFTAR